MKGNLLKLTLALLTLGAARGQTGPVSLTYVSGSSQKLYQINGDCDWTVWDASTAKTPACKPTVSQTATRADVLGDDVAVSFENNGELIMTFGDTIGTAGGYYPTWASFQNPFAWQAHDPIARSTTAHAEDGLLLNFFMDGSHALAIEPPPQPNGTPVSMGGDDVPQGGISLNGQIYILIDTGTVTGGGNSDSSKSYSLLTKFNETSQTFTSGRTISTLPGGHFVGLTVYEAPAGLLGTSPPVQPEPTVVGFGLGSYRASNVYLSVIPASQFESGLDANGNSATRYFAGMNNGQPVWSANESAATPIVTDLDPANPTIGNVSAFYSQQLGLWLMTYDGGRGSVSTAGVYFTYAPQPWGPWAAPQLIFADCRDKGFGNFIFYYYQNAAQKNCPTAMPPGTTGFPNSSGPSGPTINLANNDPTTTRGGAYAPYMVQRFTEISGSTLKIYYTLSTWNPYAVVLMESDFSIASVPTITLVANAEGGVPVIAPNTWVKIVGSNLSPANDSRTWGDSDFGNGQLPVALDGVSATVNGKSAYVYYISPNQVNILTPPDAISGPVKVVVTNNGVSSTFTAQAQALSPSFFVFDATHIVGTHLPTGDIGPTTLIPGLTTPAKPGEEAVLYANGFGPTSDAVVAGALGQSGTLPTLPVVTVGGVTAKVIYAGLVEPGLYQFNVFVPLSTPDGDIPILATYNGLSTQSGTVITVQH